MKRVATMMLAFLVALLATAAFTTNATAALRVPQVPVLGGTLQSYLNSVGESINVLTDQSATQSWTRTSSGTAAFTIQIENSANAALNSIDMYNSGAAVPSFYLLLQGPAIAQAFSTATFLPGNILAVNRFDENGLLTSSQSYAGVDPSAFSFAIQGPGGTFYTQDARNPGSAAQALAFPGTGGNAGTWWLCFEETAVNAGSDLDYDDCVLLMESVNTTPVNNTSWGQLKRRFR
ncbi:MAG: hypothetical protein ABL977_11780 [Candidatus Eisenbacteria bacterium]